MVHFSMRCTPPPQCKPPLRTTTTPGTSTTTATPPPQCKAVGTHPCSPHRPESGDQVTSLSTRTPWTEKKLSFLSKHIFYLEYKLAASPDSPAVHIIRGALPAFLATTRAGIAGAFPLNLEKHDHLNHQHQHQHDHHQHHNQHIHLAVCKAVVVLIEYRLP